MSKSLITTDPHVRLERLLKQERELGARLAELEERVRRFEDFERPAYEAWIQVELGPLLASLDELHQKIYERRLQAQRIVQRLDGGPQPKPETEAAREAQARREAKLDAKREARRQTKRQAKQEKQEKRDGGERADGKTSTSPSRTLVSLYRRLARRLHPDSPDLMRELPRERVLSLWMEVQNAYDTGNAERLLALLAWMGEGGESPSAVSYAERLARVRAMTAACTRLAKRVSELEGHPAWQFESVHGQARRKLRQQAARELEGELERTQDVLEQLEDFLKAVKRAKGPRRKGR